MNKGGTVKRRRWVATATVVATASAFGVVGAVSSGTAGARAGQARGVTDTSINVAGLSQQSQFSANELRVGATARFQVENNKGGVNGRKITYVESADDQASVTTALVR